MGRVVLAELGRSVVEGWAKDAAWHTFGGNVQCMEAYVDHYLAAMRRDFTLVVVEDLGSLQIIAEARRSPVRTWDGNLSDYKPKLAAGMYFNLQLVSAMTETANRMSAASSRNQAGARRMSARHKTYQFMFAVATAHELAHLFVAYLAQGDSDDLRSYTPPNVSFLNYGKPAPAPGRLPLGESGRWLESRLFGGSVEYYREPQDNDDYQFGTPYLVDQNTVSWKISSECVRRLVEEPRQFRFPFAREGGGLTDWALNQMGFARLGATEPAIPQPPGRLLMRGRDMPTRYLTYNIPSSELRQVAISPRPIRVAQVVSA